MAIQVRAKARGFYGNSLREPGATFPIRSEKELGSWMEKVSDAAEGKAAKGKPDPKDPKDPATPPADGVI